MKVKHTYKYYYIGFLFTVIGLISGCTHWVAHKIETFELNKIQLTGFETLQRRYCDSQNQCMLYFDLANNLEDKIFSVNFKVAGQTHKTDSQSFKFQQLPDKAPVFVLFPGFAASRAVNLMTLGFWLREQGFHVLVFPGPTEYQPFEFGLNTARAAQTILKEQFSENSVYAYGYSMGAVAVTELQKLRLEQQETSLKGAILSAPMLAFSQAGQTVLNNLKTQHFWLSWLPTSFFIKALDQVEAGQNHLSILQRETLLPKQTLFILGQNDDLSPPENLEILTQNKRFQGVIIPEMNHLELGAAGPRVSAQIYAWLIKQGALKDIRIAN